jgi:hypothetical protein
MVTPMASARQRDVLSGTDVDGLVHQQRRLHDEPGDHERSSGPAVPRQGRQHSDQDHRCDRAAPEQRGVAAADDGASGDRRVGAGVPPAEVYRRDQQMQEGRDGEGARHHRQPVRADVGGDRDHGHRASTDHRRLRQQVRAEPR